MKPLTCNSFFFPLPINWKVVGSIVGFSVAPAKTLLEFYRSPKVVIKGGGTHGPNSQSVLLNFAFLKTKPHKIVYILPHQFKSIHTI